MTDQAPLVSLVIPMFNEAGFIKQCLDSLLIQDYPIQKMEIIVVDGISTDNSRAIVSNYVKRCPNIKLLDNPQKTTPISLNIGIKQSTGSIVFILGAHAYYAKEFVSQSVYYLNKTHAKCVGGAIELLNSADNYIAKSISFVLVSPFGVSNARFRYSKKEQYLDTVCYGAYWRSVFDQVGLFDEKLTRNQDIELNSRIRKNGGKIFYTPKIKSFPYTRSSLCKMIKQNFGNGFWNVRTFYRHPGSLSIRHFVPFVFSLVLLVAFLLSFFWPVSRMFLLIGLLFYFCVAFIFSVAIAAKQGFRYLIILPIVFFIFHFCYGLGTLIGVIRLSRH